MNSPATAAVPKVSVAMITYNHEKFIAQAIESVLMQETAFPIELVVGEDCSTDDTRAIVERYAKARPDIVRPLLHDHNLGGPQNTMAVFAACRGKYIACLEGDDYWIDPRKLQKQVELMDQNPKYSMCGTAIKKVLALDGKEETESGFLRPKVVKDCYEIQDVLADYPFHTSTFVRRSGAIQFPPWLMEVTLGDECMLALHAEKGPVGYLDEVTSAFRIHNSGAWSATPQIEKLKAIRKTFEHLNCHFSGRYFHILQNRERSCVLDACAGALVGRRWPLFWATFKDGRSRFPNFVFLLMSIAPSRVWSLIWSRFIRVIKPTTHRIIS